MALSAAVTKKSVTCSQDKLYNITLTLTLTDTAGEGFVRDYSQDYRTGENVATKKALFLDKMQNDIDRYKASQALSDNAALATAITEIQSNLVL